MKKVTKLIALTVVLMITAGLASAAVADGTLVRISHKDFGEQRLLGEMLGQYLESKGYETEVSELGGTMLNWNAIVNDEVDVYVEYTGTTYATVLAQEEIIGVDETYDFVKNTCEEEYGVTWLEPLGFNNTYVLCMAPETAEEYGIKSISDLAASDKKFILGCTAEFIGRSDGIVGLKETYEGLSFANEIGMDPGLTYQALADGQIDVNSAFSTNGELAKFGLVCLEDDLGFFPPYNAVPVMKLAFAEENPGVVEALNALAGLFSDEDMQNYNLMVSEGTDMSEVAAQMLADKGLTD